MDGECASELLYPGFDAYILLGTCNLRYSLICSSVILVLE